MKLVVVILVFILYVLLFKKAAGTLKLNIMNVITFVFFSILGFELIGGSLVYLGFREHYLIQKIINENTIDKTYYILIYTSLMLPLVIILFNKYIFKIDKIKKQEESLKNKYINKLEERVDVGETKHRNRVFMCLAILAIVCTMSIIYVFICIKYIPLFQYFNSDMDLAVERINVSRKFSGNEYIKNLIMLLITPIISYISYIYMRLTKEKKWKILFAILLISSILAITYNFEKAPIIYYFLFFFIIEVMMGNTFDFKKIIPVILITAIIVLILYKIVMGYTGPIFSLSSGPMSRILITQVATLFLHVDAFPENTEYLYGRSFPKELVGFLGEGNYDVRSGRLVMELYSKSSVEKGTAGVMNTLFVGEAYANFGIIGVIVAPIIAGIFFSTILAWFLKSKKNPLNMVIYLETFIIFKDVLQGGFVDFFYNIKFLVMLLMMIGIIKIIKYDKLWIKIKFPKFLFKGEI